MLAHFKRLIVVFYTNTKQKKIKLRRERIWEKERKREKKESILKEEENNGKIKIKKLERTRGERLRFLEFFNK